MQASCDTGEQGTDVRCEVRDTGIGIPADRLASLFCALHAGGYLDDPPVRRDGPGAVDRAPVGRADGRRDRRRERRGRRARCSGSPRISRRSPTARSRSIRRPPRSRDGGCWWSMTTPPTARCSWANCFCAASIRSRRARRTRRSALMRQASAAGKRLRCGVARPSDARLRRSRARAGPSSGMTASNRRG